MEENTEPIPGDRQASGLDEDSDPQLSLHGGYPWAPPRRLRLCRCQGPQAGETVIVPQRAPHRRQPDEPVEDFSPDLGGALRRADGRLCRRVLPQGGREVLCSHDKLCLIVFYTVSRQAVLEALSMLGAVLEAGSQLIPPAPHRI